MGPVVKKRGRPKGHELTTIGLPAKKAKKDAKKPISFSKMHTSKKEEGNPTCIETHISFIYLTVSQVLLLTLN